MRRHFGVLTAALWLLLAVFVGGDAVAHFTGYKYGETVSASIWSMEKFWVVRVIVGVVLAGLFTHLEFQLP